MSPRSRSRGSLAVFGLFAALPSSLPAQLPVLPPVRVTASPVTAGDSTGVFGALTTRVGETQVRDLSALDLASALRRTPGVSIVRFNPVGAFGGGSGGAVFIRGMGMTRPGSEIKTFVDGVPLYMSVWNHPLLDLLPVHAMERVDVRKGPQPEQVGNTFAAVNLVPRRATRDGVHGDLSVSAGSFNTVMQQGALTARSGKIDLSLAQGVVRSDGHRPLADGRLVNGMLHAGYAISPAWRAELTALGVDNSAHDPGRVDEPDTRTGRFETSALTATVALRHTHSRARGSLRVYRSSGQGDWFDQPAPTGNTLSGFALSGMKLREEFVPWGDALITAGMDVDNIAGDVRFEPEAPAAPSTFESPTLRITQPHVALAQRVALGNTWSLTPSVGARWYAHSELDGATAPHAALVLRRGDALTLRARVARGVNYPGVDAVVLSSLIPPLGQSWRDLGAEQLDQVELGGMLAARGDQLSMSFIDRASLEFSAFEHRARDRYQFAFPPISAPPAFINRGTYTVRGLEASLHLDMRGGVSTFGSVTSLEPNDVMLPFTPRTSISAGLVWQSAWARVTADMQTQSDMLALPLERSANELEFPTVSGFSVWQVRVAVPVSALGPLGEVFANMENAFDRRYGYLPGYTMPGRWGMVGVRASF